MIMNEFETISQELLTLTDEWISGLNEKVSLKAMVIDFPRHFKLHLNEINELL